jgi:hypothetical protein
VAGRVDIHDCVRVVDAGDHPVVRVDVRRVEMA